MRLIFLLTLLLMTTPFFQLTAGNGLTNEKKVLVNRELATDSPKPGEILQVLTDGTLALREGALYKIPEDQRDTALRQLNDLNHKILKGELPFFDQEMVDNGNYSAGCFCVDNCCDFGICCAGGIWVFCWSFGVC